ncbi:acyl-CoA dehydrogenase family protein [Conexibacter sp. S30A1]|uniref:acyl-CoA dehydrogenase family protein n=1 Tax=Conexibacter sp. S30A1 TaxID=2937800 RepID=UPI002112F607|nr:acyl-CoA dehydrogenase family protein [Conexibacter sp. S30A1]
MSARPPAQGYHIPQEFEDLRAMVRQIAQERIAPRAREIDEKAEYPRDIRELLAHSDILGLPFAAEYGGTGTGTLMLQIAVEEIAKADASCALILMLQELGTLPIARFGSDELKARFLPRCATGEWTAAFALSEAEAGSNVAAMRTSAVQDGDEWVINGEKTWISNAGVADFYIVFAVTDRDAGRVTAFVVEADRPGFSIGGYEHKLGIKGSPTGSPVLDNVRVPAENVVGDVGHGMRVALGTLERTRLGAAAQAVGIAQGATDFAVAYAQERIAFGRPIIEMQGIQFKLADMQTGTAAARELLYRACTLADQDPAPKDLGMWTSMAKVFASDNAMRVTIQAVQVLGGYGYVRDYPVERMMRDAKITQIYEGTNEIQRVVIAKHLAR